MITEARSYVYNLDTEFAFQLLAGNPRRIYMRIEYDTAFTISVGPSLPATRLSGPFVLGQNSVVELVRSDVGSVIAGEWYLQADFLFGGVRINVTEIFTFPK